MKVTSAFPLVTVALVVSSLGKTQTFFELLNPLPPVLYNFWLNYLPVILACAETPEEITVVFHSLDVDPKDGYVSIAEMKAAGMDTEDKKFMKNFRKADVNKDYRLCLKGMYKNAVHLI